jgi:DNA-binding response OmpR family regulator
MKILLIEDEKSLQEVIVDYLNIEGYIVEIAADFSTALEKISLYEYDCVLLDITLPDGNGLDIIQTVKETKPETGIIILSAKGSIDDKIKGLELGSDDYLPKPFHLAELNARIRSLRRRRQYGGKNEIIFNEIKILPDSFQVFVHENEIILTKKEFDLLLFFVTNKKRVVTKQSVVEHAWGDNIDQVDSYDFIYTHIKNLRKKLTDKGSGDYVRSIYGIGYKFTDE